MEHFGYLVRRLFWLFVIALSLITALFIALLTYRPSLTSLEEVQLVEENPEEWQPGDVLAAFEDGSMAPNVKSGFLLVSQTPGEMDPRLKM
ncbi:hypothetical protein NYZ99_12015 [Maribacter litopenaei]|uniref:Signal peptide peptidase SppA n=1 Tax=Maribacter litopenaei TaxID=2976127 RepID=A0ABY5Y7A0_9FLAO|nr:hypothetical protein [Maribacter litopenaei]UWX53851.1 hypothetical protein NYZ99_12015 [Maribacter litopenaei]